MANATDVVKKGVVRRTDEFINLPLSATVAERKFWPNAMLGVDGDGYVDKFDDTQSMVFAGVFRGTEGKLTQPVESDGTRDIEVHQPQRFELAIASIAEADKGKPVFTVDDQTGTLNPSATTCANVVGHVVCKVATGIALVEPAYDGVAANKRLGVARTLAATGAQSLGKYDIGKKILVPNTAALTVTLPAVASCPVGGELEFVKTTADAFAVTLDGNASETIDGAATLATIDAAYDCARLVNTGTGWVVACRDIA